MFVIVHGVRNRLEGTFQLGAVERQMNIIEPEREELCSSPDRAKGDEKLNSEALSTL